jgi:hypothetical protein
MRFECTYGREKTVHLHPFSVLEIQRVRDSDTRHLELSCPIGVAGLCGEPSTLQGLMAHRG